MPGAFADLVWSELGGFAEADQEQALCLQAGWIVQQQSLAGFGLEFAAVEDGLDGLGGCVVGRQQADFGLCGVLGRGVDGEDGEEFGGDFSGGSKNSI